MPTQRLSEFLDTLLKPIVVHQKTYVKDDWDFLYKLPKEFKEPVSLYSYDITSLYTSIPHDLGLKAIEYWITKRNDLIPDRFSNNFILESAKFILENNNFFFDNILYKQVKGTAMGTKFAPSYACLSIGFLEENLLYPSILPKYFNSSICKYMEDNNLRYMDDSFIALPKEIDPIRLKDALNEMNSSIKFTMAIGKTDAEQTEFINFLDIKVILKENRFVSTDIYYKETNPHKYLDFNSAHPSHIKQTIPFNLAKRIVIFVSDSDLVETRLNELENWLIECNYPKSIIKQAFHRAKLQGPAPEKQNKNILPLVTTFYPNCNFNSIMQTIRGLFENFSSEDTKRKFQNTQPILSLKQPPSISSMITRAKFVTQMEVNQSTTPGITLCTNSRCKLCKFYLQPVNSFKTAKNTIWDIKSHINCNSKNVIYFLSCNSCAGNINYIGQTTNFRLRMNCHISESRSCVSSCVFPRHVHQCGKDNNNSKEPFLKFMHLCL